MAYDQKTWADGELVTAEDLNRIEQGLQATSALAEGTASRVDGVEADLAATAGTVDQIKLANVSAGEGAPTGAAPVGWRYLDLATGDHYRMEA